MLSKLSEWPSEAEAAARLGTSVKTIIRYASQGKIELRKRQRLGKKPENVCNPRDLEALQPKLHVMLPPGQELTAAPAEVQTAELIVGDVMRQMAEQFQRNGDMLLAQFKKGIDAELTARWSLQQAAPPQTPKLWLSLEEAATYSGLTPKFLRDSIVAPTYYQEGRNIIGVYGGTRGSWRICRKSLEAFEG